MKHGIARRELSMNHTSYNGNNQREPKQTWRWRRVYLHMESERSQEINPKWCVCVAETVRNKERGV